METVKLYSNSSLPVQWRYNCCFVCVYRFLVQSCHSSPSKMQMKLSALWMTGDVTCWFVCKILHFLFHSTCMLICDYFGWVHCVSMENVNDSTYLFNFEILHLIVVYTHYKTRGDFFTVLIIFVKVSSLFTSHKYKKPMKHYIGWVKCDLFLCFGLHR